MNEAAKRTVLIIDDDPDFLEQMRLALLSEGYNVVAAGGETEAEQVLGRLRPDLVICDLMMENMDAGFVLSHKIKTKDPSIPVILVTAVTSQTGLSFEGLGTDERAWIKADGLLSKPVRIEQVRREIARLLPGAS